MDANADRDFRQSADDLYGGLSELCYSALFDHEDNSSLRKLNEATIHESFSATLELAGASSPQQTARQWLSELQKEHLFVADGRDFVFVHGTVMEFLAGFYLLEHFDDPEILDQCLKARRQSDGRDFMESLETLPIVCGSSFDGAAEFFRRASQYFSEAGRERKLFQCLAETEAMEERYISDVQTNRLQQRRRESLQPGVNERLWGYQRLANLVLAVTESDVPLWEEWMSAELPLSRSIFPETHFAK